MEDCLYDERNALLDDLQLDMLEQTHQEAMQFTSSLLHDDDDDEDVSIGEDGGNKILMEMVITSLQGVSDKIQPYFYLNPFQAVIFFFLE